MPRTRTSALLAPALLAGALAAGACTTQVRGAVYVPTAPPPPVAEVAPASPGPGYVWIAGYHRWDGARYVWVGGRWEIGPSPRALGAGPLATRSRRLDVGARPLALISNA